MNAEVLMLIAGLTAFVLTLHWVRRRELREKYALMWIFLAFALLILGAFPQILMKFAAWASLSYPAAVLFGALGLIYLFAFSVSLSLSKAHLRTTRLLQEFAILEERVHELEKEKTSDSD